MKVEDNKWKAKFQTILNQAHSELKKTTAIGMKMLSASQSNTQLKESYEKLGVLVLDAIKNGDLDWDNPEVKSLASKIDQLEHDLKQLEEEVQNIKKD